MARIHVQSPQRMVFDEQGNYHGLADRLAHYAQGVPCPLCGTGRCRDAKGKDLPPLTVHLERAEAAL